MYKKNTSGQFIAFQGIVASTGAILSGATWTVRRCIDGTFAAATGTVTEDSTNGWYKFAMSQADTNGNNIEFNFTASTAVPQTVNILTDGAPPDVNLKTVAGTSQTAGDLYSKLTGLTFTVANQVDVNVVDWKGATAPAMTGDAFARLGAPAGASVSADIAAIKAAQLTGAQTATAVWTDTTAGDFTTALSIGKSILNGVTLGTGLTINSYTGNTAQTGDSYARLGAPAGASISADIAAVKTDTAAIKVQTDKFVFSVANQVDSNVIDWKGSAAPAMTGDAYARLGAPAGGSVSADIAAIKSDSGAIKTQTDKLTFTVLNQIDANVLDWKSATAPAMTGDAFARLGAPSGASISADIASVQATFPSNFNALVISAGGRVKIQSGIQKNTALAKFEFQMTDSTNHAPATGLTVSVERSIDAGAFASGALSAVTEIGGGIYSVDFAAGDLNGNVITLQATATGADTLNITIVTDA